MPTASPTRGPRSTPATRHPAGTGTWWFTPGPTCRVRTRTTSCAGTFSEGRAMTSEPHDSGDVVELPAASNAVDIALDELEMVYAFIYARVGNRADAEDLTQQVAMKAIPRLRQGAPASAIRGYLFATARSVLGGFWSTRLGLSESELHEDLLMAMPTGGYSQESADRAALILAALSDNYRRVLELRFLHGYSLKEVAAEMRSTVGAVKVMQLRALRAAAKVRLDA
ncbi:MAG: sigma-70 family RNA polymerase sigma factor [Chloroflexi bacterium]|nr:MAG: sigma-70 family RNA polymerase sigma factor [Chloroflexota bacterium]